MIVDKLLKQSRTFVYCFVMFKILLLLFYVISGYQAFTVRTIHSILRIMVVNDIFLLLFILLSLVHAAVNRSYRRGSGQLYLVLALSNMLFSLFTMSSAILIIVLTSGR